jgi:cholesterol transport system auxiliary component
MSRIIGLVLAVLLASTNGCALFGKADALDPRYFDPGTAEHSVSRTPPKKDEPALPAVRLGRVVASEHLKERLVYRASNEEIKFYEDRRWTEQPESYLRRALARALFEDTGLRQVVSGAGPTLEAEMTAFEEVRAPKPYVRVSITVVVHDDSIARLRHTFTVDKPLDSGGSADQIVKAIALALTEVTDEIAKATVTTLARVEDEDKKAAAAPPVP